jgi:hypothetical protein
MSGARNFLQLSGTYCTGRIRTVMVIGLYSDMAFDFKGRGLYISPQRIGEVAGRYGTVIHKCVYLPGSVLADPGQILQWSNQGYRVCAALPARNDPGNSVIPIWDDVRLHKPDILVLVAGNGLPESLISAIKYKLFASVILLATNPQARLSTAADLVLNLRDYVDGKPLPPLMRPSTPEEQLLEYLEIAAKSCPLAEQLEQDNPRVHGMIENVMAADETTETTTLRTLVALYAQRDLPPLVQAVLCALALHPGPDGKLVPMVPKEKYFKLLQRHNVPIGTEGCAALELLSELGLLSAQRGDHWYEVDYSYTLAFNEPACKLAREFLKWIEGSRVRMTDWMSRMLTALEILGVNPGGLDDQQLALVRDLLRLILHNIHAHILVHALEDRGLRTSEQVAKFVRRALEVLDVPAQMEEDEDAAEEGETPTKSVLRLIPGTSGTAKAGTAT